VSSEAERLAPEIDAVARLRAIAAALPHVAYRERTIEAPLDAVWAILGDLEGGVPRFDRYVRRIRITRREGERLSLVSNGPLGLPMRFEAILRPGWCVMRSWQAEVGMAAAPLGPGRTRVGHFEGSRFLGALGRWWFGRTMERELAKLARLCEVRAPASR
jgi:hypothetical protein